MDVVRSGIICLRTNARYVHTAHQLDNLIVLLYLCDVDFTDSKIRHSLLPPTLQQLSDTAICNGTLKLYSVSRRCIDITIT